MNKFAVDVSKWANKTSDGIENIRKAIIFELFSSVIMDTPVDTGRLRGNWVLSSGLPYSGTVSLDDPSGGRVMLELKTFVDSGVLKTDQVIYMSNNLPYAYRIEYDGWSHTKAPQGMVRKNFIRVSQNLKLQNP